MSEPIVRTALTGWRARAVQQSTCSLAVPDAGRLTAPRPSARPAAPALTWVLGLSLLIALTVGGGAALRGWWQQYVEPGPSPAVVQLDLHARIADLTEIVVTVGGEHNAPWRTTVDDLRRNRWLWRLMHVANWNVVPPELRDDVLERMLVEYRPMLMNPRVWDAMSAEDWDAVPQPIRTIAYRQMTTYWAGFYDVGERYNLDVRQVRDTLQAIVMSESWFDHRAHRIDVTGNQDIGLAQASDYARDRVRQLAAQDVVDVSFSDDDYVNPWKATRFLAVWMTLILDETGGDLEFAIRAYNRGVARAHDRAGDVYLDAVLRRRHRFIQNQDAPPTWTWLWCRARAIEVQEWPWLHSGPAGASDAGSPRCS